MNILSRISLLPTGNYTSIIEKQIEYFIKKCNKYVLDEDMKLM